MSFTKRRLFIDDTSTVLPIKGSVTQCTPGEFRRSIASSAKTAPIFVYVDGSCPGNPAGGGWGCVIVCPNNKLRAFSGYVKDTTNNRMEITAVLEALKVIPNNAYVMVYSDSQYVVNTIMKGWKISKNQDLWHLLSKELQRLHVNMEWVKGHSGNKFNVVADKLAGDAAKGKVVPFEE